MKTVLGLEWPVADTIDIVLIFVFILLVLLFFGLMMYYLNQKKKQAQEQQYFLYKTKQLGLTTAQTKMLNSIIVMISLRNLRRMLTESALFESAIKSFLEYLTRKGETGESLQPVCRDLAITHEKLYHPATYRKPLDSLLEIEKNTMLHFHDESGRCFIGKVTGDDGQNLAVRLIPGPGVPAPAAGAAVEAYLWRTGDADYTFRTTVTGADDSGVKLKLPESFSRGKEVRRPYVDAMIPCEISFQIQTRPRPKEEEEASPEEKTVTGMIYKLNENEIVARVSQEIDFKREYLINFQIADFNVKARSLVIADRTIHEEQVHYYAFKFVELSQVAQNILKNYVTERLA